MTGDGPDMVLISLLGCQQPFACLINSLVAGQHGDAL